MSKNENVNNHIQCLSSYINRLERNLKSRDNQIESLRRLNNTIKLCKSDYYNQICTLSSKISLINNYINDDKNCVPKHIYDYINKIIFDKNIKLGSDKE